MTPETPRQSTVSGIAEVAERNTVPYLTLATAIPFEVQAPDGSVCSAVDAVDLAKRTTEVDEVFDHDRRRPRTREVPAAWSRVAEGPVLLAKVAEQTRAGGVLHDPRREGLQVLQEDRVQEGEGG